MRCVRADDVKAALNKTTEVFGRLDDDFDNAGVEQVIMATADLTEDEWDWIVGINPRGMFSSDAIPVRSLQNQKLLQWVSG